MKHRGEIVNDVIRKNGINLTSLAQKLTVSRTTLYRWFEEPNLSLDVIYRIGEAINYDFSKEIKELFDFSKQIVEEPTERYKSVTNTKVSITVELDGTEETINKWLRLLPELNKVVQLKAG